jgi:hypothetical protein
MTCNGGGECDKQVGAVYKDKDGNTQTFDNAPLVLNRADPTGMAMGGHLDVYVTQDTASAEAKSIDLKLTDVGSASGDVQALAYGTPKNPSALLAGDDNKGLFLSTDATKGSLTQITRTYLKIAEGCRSAISME